MRALVLAGVTLAGRVALQFIATGGGPGIMEAANRGAAMSDCLDHMLIFGEQHLRKALKAYSVYYNESRTNDPEPS